MNIIIAHVVPESLRASSDAMAAFGFRFSAALRRENAKRLLNTGCVFFACTKYRFLLLL
jgi:hypothetical protein